MLLIETATGYRRIDLDNLGRRWGLIANAVWREHYAQHSPCDWTGGHLTDPKEQNTQQSPAFGLRSSPQRVHS